MLGKKGQRMPEVFIFHGVFGNPQENWFPWLKDELQKRDYPVTVPHFLSIKNDAFSHWLAAMNPYEDILKRHCIFVAHSLGVPFALRLLENQKAKAAFLVSGFTGALNSELSEYTDSIAFHEFQ